MWDLISPGVCLNKKIGLKLSKIQQVKRKGKTKKEDLLLFFNICFQEHKMAMQTQLKSISQELNKN